MTVNAVLSTDLLTTDALTLQRRTALPDMHGYSPSTFRVQTSLTDASAAHLP